MHQVTYFTFKALQIKEVNLDKTFLQQNRSSLKYLRAVPKFFIEKTLPVYDLGQVIKLTPLIFNTPIDELRQTTNPSIERDSPEKREERTEQLNEEYYFFTCETLTNNM